MNKVARLTVDAKPKRPTAIMLRVYNIKYAWHGRDPSIQGPGTPPVAPEHNIELRHQCRLCRKRSLLQVSC